jgi:hypothetical protein
VPSGVTRCREADLSPSRGLKSWWFRQTGRGYTEGFGLAGVAGLARVEWEDWRASARDLASDERRVSVTNGNADMASRSSAWLSCALLKEEGTRCPVLSRHGMASGLHHGR